MLLLFVLGGFSLWGASTLGINTNQLDLISQELQIVKDLKRIIDMSGGAGHLLIAFRGRDEKILKRVVDDVVAHLRKDTKNIRRIRYRVSQEFIRQKAPLFVKTKDLQEIRRQVVTKIKDVVRRANPFFFEIEPTKPYKTNLKPIIKKYMSVGKKNITDDYYISPDKQMIMLVVKPRWESTELRRTGELLAKIRGFLKAYKNKGVSLHERASRDPDKNPKIVGFGFTGSYKTNYDDSFSIRNSLLPTSGVALLGIFLSMLLFFRRRIGAIFLVVSGLLVGILLTFGLAKVLLGELNMITSIIAGILMGQGIDFGIHFIYRLREEMGRGKPLEEAIHKTIVESGTASFISAAALGAAFFALYFSDFRGFSHFGLLAGFGVFVIGTVIYIWSPAILLLLARRWPNAPAMLIGTMDVEKTIKQDAKKPIPWVTPTIAVVGSVVLLLAYFAPQVKFNYDSRALMVENQPSILLQEEIKERYKISSDPVAVFAKNLKEVKKLYDTLTPLDPKRFSEVDQVVSIYTLVPPMDQQLRNIKVLQAMKHDLRKIKRKAIPAKHRKRYDQLMGYLDTKPYTLKELPPLYYSLFKSIKSAKPENQGYLTYLYPKVAMWHGKSLLKFSDQVERIKTKDGQVFRTAGISIVYATLARIVLFDGKFSVGLTAILLIIILLIDFRSLASTLMALIPLFFGVVAMLGIMKLMNWNLNFMNIVVFPIVLGYGISHGVYFMHRFHEGTSPAFALRSVGVAVACSTLTTLAGWSALLTAEHQGLKSMGILACVGMSATLLISFTIMPAILQLVYSRRQKNGNPPAQEEETPAPTKAAA